ncbi:MAG TPA: single-stranded-DNA-specific exonuclease RecJ, partial [Novosphingobium sp.]|nr:single-stranded-DNA-specific exonuclease RecJ [Novosphingobium sp.]
MSTTANSILGLGRSLAGKTWQWRGGNMDLATGATSLDHDLVTQLLLARGIPPHDVERHRTPSLRAFLPDPSEFRDMDTAA